MARTDQQAEGKDFLKSLGFPTIDVHDTFSHFDFTLPGRRVLLIGPMGSGKTEFAARVWRDAAIAQKKGEKVRFLTSSGDVDRRKVFFIRSEIDGARFSEYPEDALCYRSGYVSCGTNIARIRDSFGLEQVLADNPTVGTFIIDEASFFDERLAYVVRNHSYERGVMFIFPTLILNFRRDLFNSTARLMLDIATDVIPLTAYCEHPDCMKDAFYTYRYYQVDGQECPALYFDPLIIVGGDAFKTSTLEPNYAARCDEHHYLPGKEYTFFHLKPLGEQAARGDEKPLRKELDALKHDMERSMLYSNIQGRYAGKQDEAIFFNSLKPANIAEKALIFLFCEHNLIPEELLLRLVDDLELDRSYMEKVLADNKRPVSFEQSFLF
ncbi:thymidine kinase [Sphaerochaeta sp. PS]|uniref:thymidine kinase n=1 Tax=Sphaerochaeta sp. PS TaxID=3076336 RepID=UPI0028A52707|nr:thymidine kinase [Sphaerochaeta sp. PS]MDT4762422.1 thymidine kinase [Sphaerochaeta sp. PS]